MESRAELKFVRITPRKAMLVADLIRGKHVNEAFGMLQFSSRKRVAGLFSGLLKSAVANLNQTSQGRVNAEQLFITRVEVGKGPTIKRFRPRAMGRAHNLNKKTCHLSISVGEKR